jgi:ZIP family zinc transporter
VDNVWTALALTTFAGLATGIGSAIAFTAKRTNYRFLSVATGFSAGVMLYVSFVEIFFKGATALTERYGAFTGYWVNTVAFFGGIALIGVIDTLIPAGENPHETHAEVETAPLHDVSAQMPQGAVTPGAANAGPGLHDHTADHHRLMRMGLFTALAIGIHNFPEGLATFLAALQDPGLGVAIAIAIALHNIPEGISVSVPIFYATGDRKKAFIYSLLSGLSEPVGAAIAYVVLIFLLGGAGAEVPHELMGILFAGVAGIMVYISLDELLPTSRAYGKGHDSLFGLVGGMLVMAISLVLMR